MVDELQPMQAFVVAVLEFMAERHRDSLLTQLVVDAGRPMTKSQVAMLLSDLLEWNQDLADRDLHALDAGLARRGLPTFTLMRRRQDRDFARVLSTGRISSDEQWRLVNARVSDVNGPLSDADRALAERLLEHYQNGGTV